MKVYQWILVGITVLSAILAYFTFQKFFSEEARKKAQIETWESRTERGIEEEYGKLKGLKEGDVLFQVSQSGQSRAIQLATGSKYSHCGIVLKHKGEMQVLEAVQPVKFTPLKDWVKRGKNGHFVVKRYIGHERLNDSIFQNMHDYSKAVLGKDYDSYFEWSDDKIYCSELVWKIYKEAAGVELAELETMQDFDFSSDEVRTKLKERFGENLPEDEKVISPKAIFDSRLLYTLEEM